MHINVSCRPLWYRLVLVPVSAGTAIRWPFGSANEVEINDAGACGRSKNGLGALCSMF